MAIIKFVNEKKEIQVAEGSNLRDEAMRAGVEIYTPLHRVPLLGHCPGLGCCGTCRVLITKGMDHASAPTFMERQRFKLSLAYIGNEANMRLACQTTVNGDMDVVTQPPVNWFGDNFFS